MRIFDNTNALKREIIERRLQALDANATANPYSVERADKSLHHYVGVDCSLSDAQIESCLGPIAAADTAAETAERERQAWIQQRAREAVQENRQHIKYIENILSARFPGAFHPQPWSE